MLSLEVHKQSEIINEPADFVLKLVERSLYRAQRAIDPGKERSDDFVTLTLSEQLRSKIVKYKAFFHTNRLLIDERDIGDAFDPNETRFDPFAIEKFELFQRRLLDSEEMQRIEGVAKDILNGPDDEIFEQFERWEDVLNVDSDAKWYKGSPIRLRLLNTLIVICFLQDQLSLDENEQEAEERDVYGNIDDYFLTKFLSSEQRNREEQYRQERPGVFPRFIYKIPDRKHVFRDEGAQKDLRAWIEDGLSEYDWKTIVREGGVEGRIRYIREMIFGRWNQLKNGEQDIYSTRTCEVRAGRFCAPTVTCYPEFLDRLKMLIEPYFYELKLISDEEKKIEAISRWARLVYVFGILIHPFPDGNGQTFRILLNSYLYEAGIKDIKIQKKSFDVGYLICGPNTHVNRSSPIPPQVVEMFLVEWLYDDATLHELIYGRQGYRQWVSKLASHIHPRFRSGELDTRQRFKEIMENII